MSDFLKGCPEPPTELGRYRILSSTAGVRVSPLCLGAGSFGTAWAKISTSVDEEQSFKILDAFAEAGGNFIDCANVYQNGQSETILGKWMASRNNRDMMVVATKYTGDYRLFDLGPGKTVNYSGNHRKSMFLSLQASLEKLQTTYVDLLFVHMWDFSTSVEEVMGALHVHVQLQTKKQLEARKQAGEGLRAIHGPEQTEDERKISEALEKVAAEHGTESIQQIALAYISQKTRNVIPLVGVRKVEQLQDNIKSLSIHLTDEQIKYLEGIKEFDPGFPATVIGEDPRETRVSGPMIASFAHTAWQKASWSIGRGWTAGFSFTIRNTLLTIWKVQINCILTITHV
ncbi:hypothetical protein Neosp_009965 [[Neocosmospora] mangrovei]